MPDNAAMMQRAETVTPRAKLASELPAARLVLRTDLLWPSAIVALGLLIRLYRLGGWSPNEAMVVRSALQPLSEMWGFIIGWDPYHPPLFPALLHLWMNLGRSELMLRLLPVLLGTLSICMLYRIGAYLIDRRTGLMAAFILAISPLHIWHSQEVRMYALLFFLSLVALDALARILKEGRPVHWIAYVIAATLSLYAEAGAVLVLLAHTAAVTVLRLVRQGPPLGKWLLTQTIVIFLFLPWAAVVWSLLSPQGVVRSSEPQFPYESSPLGVPPQVANIGFVIAAFTSSFLPEGEWLIKAVVAACFGTVFLVGVWALRHRSVPLVLLASVAVVPLIVGVALSFEIGALRPRTAIPASAAYYLLLAVGFLTLTRRRLGQLLLVALVAVNLFSLVAMFHRNPEKQMAWDHLAQYIASSVRPGEGVIFVDGVWRLVFDLYYPDRQTPASTGYATPADLQTIRKFIGNHTSLYLILKGQQDADPAGSVRNYIQSQLHRQSMRTFSGGIIVEYYRR